MGPFEPQFTHPAASKSIITHADFTYEKKYGIRDYRGGGRTVSTVTPKKAIPEPGDAIPN